MRCKGMASERGWKAPFRSGAHSTLVFPLRLSEKGAGTVSGRVNSGCSKTANDVLIGNGGRCPLEVGAHAEVSRSC